MANKKLLILGNPQGSGPSGDTVWGDITGNLADQTDLQNALNAKANSSDLATVASSGSYNDLTDKPTIPTVNDATITIQQNGTTVGTFTTNDSTDTTINLTGGGSDVDENQVLLPLYFENISDTSKDIALTLNYNVYGGIKPSISLQKSSDNINWENITIPTTDGGSTTISIPAKSRVYIKGVNSKFCNFQQTSSGIFYNHYSFTTESNNTEYIFVGGNLMSLLRGDDFTTYYSTSTYNLSAYAFCKLFSSGFWVSNGTTNIKHFDKMIIGFPSGASITPGNNTFSYMFDDMMSYLNLSHRSINFNVNPPTDCCAGMQNIILNNFFNYNYDILRTNSKDYLHVGFAGGAGIVSYNKLADKPNMSTETLTFVDANNVETTVVVYVQPTV